ncbi:MAG: hypothetical protein AAFO91_10295 [Bacteroidota bacterium]
MGVLKEIEQLRTALSAASREALDVLQATEDMDATGLAELGHNGVRDAAKDAHNICNSLLRRLGAPPIEPEIKVTASGLMNFVQEGAKVSITNEASLNEASVKKTNIEKAIEENKQVADSEGFSFPVDFLQTEFDSEKDADLPATNQRLFDEYSELELTRPHGGLIDVRYRLLHSKFFAFKG